MCGIFGIKTTGIEPRRIGEFCAFIDALAACSNERGRHATGFSAIINEEEVFIDKMPKNAPDFVRRSLSWHKFKRQIRPNCPVVMIGHTRNATNGNPKNNANNHPFSGPRYDVVHNGWIYEHLSIARHNRWNLNTDCDSEIILHALESEATIRNGVIKAFDELDASAWMAVAVIDKSTSDLILFRNKSNPLVCLFFKRWNAYVFCSTPRIMWSAWEESGIAGNITESSDFVLEEHLEKWDLPSYALISFPSSGGVIYDDVEDEVDVSHHYYARHMGFGMTSRTTLTSNHDDMASIVNGTSTQTFYDEDASLHDVGVATSPPEQSYTKSIRKQHSPTIPCIACNEPIALSDPIDICEDCCDAAWIESSAESYVPGGMLICTNGSPDVYSTVEGLVDARPIKDELELEGLDAQDYMRLTELSPSRSCGMWKDMTINKMKSLGDGEYGAYISWLILHLGSFKVKETTK